MDAMTTLVLAQRRWTREERDSLPADGHRHELLDGTLIATPSPKPFHQRMSHGLIFALMRACPPSLEVFHAPMDITLAEDTVLQPDLLVVSRDQVSELAIKGVPLLAIEIASPSTRLVDRNMKLPRFAQSGCPSFWILDPEVPSLTAWELRDGGYVEVAHVEDDESWTATRPFAVTITPADLLT